MQLFIVVNIVFALLTSAVLTRAKIQTLSFENNWNYNGLKGIKYKSLKLKY